MSELETVMKISVRITDCVSVCGSFMDCSLVSFDAVAQGKYFNGRTVGSCVDTQKTDKTGLTLLSARYMLEGTDFEGKSCHIFVENNSDVSGRCTPVIVTDSKALSYLESAKLSAEITPIDGGVCVKIIKVN